MRLTGYWRREGLQEPLIGSYLRSADETLLLCRHGIAAILVLSRTGLISPVLVIALSYVPLESGRNVFAQPPMSRLVMEHPGHAQVPRFPLPLFGARPEQGSGQQKSATKPHQN